jgi:hypothetical protein
MKPKYDLLKAIGPGIRDLMPPSPPPTDLQVLLLRLAMREAERAHYGGSMSELRPEAGISNRA